MVEEVVSTTTSIATTSASELMSTTIVVVVDEEITGQETTTETITATTTTLMDSETSTTTTIIITSDEAESSPVTISDENESSSATTTSPIQETSDEPERPSKTTSTSFSTTTQQSSTSITTYPVTNSPNLLLNSDGSEFYGYEKTYEETQPVAVTTPISENNIIDDTQETTTSTTSTKTSKISLKTQFYTSRPETSLYSKSKIQEQLDKILAEQLSIIKQQQQQQQQQIKQPSDQQTGNKYYQSDSESSVATNAPGSWPEMNSPAQPPQPQPPAQHSPPMLVYGGDDFMGYNNNSKPSAGAVIQPPQLPLFPLPNRKNPVARIHHLLFNFDYIDLKKNQIEVLTSDTQAILYAQIINRTDIFKGINGGAIYLHAKTSLYLNLEDYSNSLCLTGSNEPNIESICSNGWTVSFWIKASTHFIPL